jgi:lipopolysaccharide export system permease protein
VPRFDRYLLSQMIVLFGFFSLVLVSVYWINRAVILFDQLIADGQSAAVVLEFTALSLPNVVRLVLPMSAFIAAVYVTNRMTSDSELVVVQATGFSSFRMARPVVVFGLVVALMMAVLVHFLVPMSRERLADRNVEISNNITARLLTEGQFLHPTKGVTFYLRAISEEGELLDVFLSDERNPARSTIFMARRAFLVREDTGPKLILFEGMAQTLDTGTGRLVVTNFDDFAYDIGSLLTKGNARSRDVREYDTATLLWPTPEALAATGAARAVFRYEANLRLAQPFSPLVAALIGFSALLVGGFSRFGVWRQILLAVVLLIIVQLLENAAASTARRDGSLWFVVYVPPAAGLLAAAVMLAISERPGVFRRRTRNVPKADA